MNFVTEMVLGVIRDFLGDLFSYIGFTIMSVYSIALEANKTSVVSSLCLFTMMLGAVLCAVMAGKQIIGAYGLGIQGDPEQDAVEIIFRLCAALGMMGGNTFLFNELVRFTNAVAVDITNAFSGEIRDDRVSSLLEQIVSLCTNGPVYAICMAGIAVGLVLFAISSVLRAAEITLSKILLPLFALDLMNANHEKWNMFIFQYGMSFLSYLLQMLCFNMFLYNSFRRIAIGPEEWLVMIGWLILTIRSPKWLEKYVYATGTGRAVSGGAGRLGQVVMYATMMRR